MRTKPELKTLCTCLFAFCWSKLCQIINLCYRQMIVVATLSNKFRMEKTEILNKLLICFNLDIFFSFFLFLYLFYRYLGLLFAYVGCFETKKLFAQHNDQHSWIHSWIVCNNNHRCRQKNNFLFIVVSKLAKNLEWKDNI